MEHYLKSLDEYFCAHYSDYVRLSALEGYKMPDVLFVASDGNIARKDSSCMRLCYQEQCEELLKKLKSDLVDTDFTFTFSFPRIADRIRDKFDKYTFAALLPKLLAHSDETVESAGKKLAIEPRFWQKIVKGKLYPEKCTVLALALVCRMQEKDVNDLLAVCGYVLKDDSVRDIVVGYLVKQKIFNEGMRDKCLAEYHIENLPIARDGGQKEDEPIQNA